MREDMAKVIVERPRRGSSMRGRPAKGRHRQRRLEDLPRREGMKRPYGWDTKDLNEHLAPLVRYLEAQVGRPWDKVYSEVCANIDRRSAVQDHVRDHVFDIVAVHAILIDGVPCSGEGRTFYEPLYRTRWQKLYVCPRSGLLRRIRLSREEAWKKPARPESLSFSVDDTHQCRRVNGQWCLVTLKRLPDQGTVPADRDLLSGRQGGFITIDEANRRYGGPFYAVAVRPVSKAELRSLPVPVDLW